MTGSVWRWPTQHTPIPRLRRALSRDAKARQDETARVMPDAVGQRHRECQWIEGDGRPARFCGEPVTPGKSYCAHHAARAYSKTEKAPP